MMASGDLDTELLFATDLDQGVAITEAIDLTFCQCIW